MTANDSTLSVAQAGGDLRNAGAIGSLDSQSCTCSSLDRQRVPTIYLLAAVHAMPRALRFLNTAGSSSGEK